MTTKEYYQIHKEQFKISNRKRYLKNKEKYLAKNKERYERKKEEILQKQHEWYLANKERMHEYNKRYNEKHAAREKIKRDNARQEVLDYYGNKCSCCGETIKEFLTIDHINGGGNSHRRSLGGPGNTIYFWLIKNGFPEGFQILCYNCNCAKSHNNGICPHKELEVLNAIHE